MYEIESIGTTSLKSPKIKINKWNKISQLLDIRLLPETDTKSKTGATGKTSAKIPTKKNK